SAKELRRLRSDFDFFTSEVLAQGTPSNPGEWVHRLLIRSLRRIVFAYDPALDHWFSRQEKAEREYSRSTFRLLKHTIRVIHFLRTVQVPAKLRISSAGHAAPA